MTDQEKIDLYLKHYGNDANKASCFGLIVSFLIPIVGIVCYFAQRDRVENPNVYLYAAFWGFILNLIIMVSMS